MKRAVLRSGLFGALVFVLLLSGLLLFNFVLLPALVTDLTDRMANRFGMTVTVRSSRYFPIRGVVLQDLELRTARRAERREDPVRPASPSSSIRVRIPEIRMRLRVLPLIMRSSSAAVIRKLVIERPEVTVSLGGRETSGRTDRKAAPEPGSPQETVRSSGGSSPPFPAGMLYMIRDRTDRLVRHRFFPEQIRLIDASVNIAPQSSGSSLIGTTTFDLELVHEIRDRSIGIIAGGSAGADRSGGGWEGRLALHYPDFRTDGSLRIIDLSADSFPDLDEFPIRRFLRHGLLNARVEISLPGSSDGGKIASKPGSIRGDFSLTDGDFLIPAAAADPISGLAVSYVFAARIDPYRSIAEPRIILSSDPYAAAYDDSSLSRPYGAIVFEQGDLNIGEIGLQVLPCLRGLSGVSSGKNGLQRESYPDFPVPARIDLKVRMPETSVQKILETVPTSLLGELAGTELDGSLAWDLDLEIPMDRISHMNWISSPVLRNFRVRTLPADMNPFKLNDAFSYRIVDETLPFERFIAIPAPREVPLEWFLAIEERLPMNLLIDRQKAAEREDGTERQPAEPVTLTLAGSGRTTVAGPGIGMGREPAAVSGADPDYRYVRLTDMSMWIPRAVLTTEDGDFFFHHGINWNTFKSAVQKNLEAGGIRYGASTLTMQIGKNLFLDAQQLFSRKLQEAFLVFLVEHAAMVPKERILEIYLNIAEFGPGIFGIFDASRYYFGKHPADIGASEAVWLASILPAPKRFHRYFEAGEISDGWFAHMKSYMDIMLERKRMTEEEHRTAVAEKPVFVRTAEGEPAME